MGWYYTVIVVMGLWASGPLQKCDSKSGVGRYYTDIVVMGLWASGPSLKFDLGSGGGQVLHCHCSHGFVGPWALSKL